MFTYFEMLSMRYIPLLFCFLLEACTMNEATLNTGTWRVVLEIQGQHLPFNLDLDQSKNGTYTAWLRNAEERLLMDEVTVTNDSIEIVIHTFDAVLKASIRQPDVMHGVFIINYADDYRIPFTAYHGQSYRFTPVDTAASVTDFTGKYDVQFFNESNTVNALGIISQTGNYATGTFLTPTGDYRYLEGNVINDTLWLSTFDGNHLYLFNAVKENNRITGTHWLGRSRNRRWQGVLSENAQPPPTESLTYLKKGYDRLEFTFPDVDGRPVSLQDDVYKNNVVLVQILGTWCPNCMDETRFLVDWYSKNAHRGVDIIGLAYEQKPDFEYASSRVKKMMEKLHIPYTVLIAGESDNAKASETLPALNRVVAFPTTIFVGRDGKVKYIHTGFSGPGTGVYFEQEKERFNEIVNQLVNNQ